MYGSNDLAFTKMGCGFVQQSWDTNFSDKEVDKQKVIYKNHVVYTDPEKDDIYKKYNVFYDTSVTSSLHENMNFNSEKETKYMHNPLNNMNLGNHGKHVQVETDFFNTRIIQEIDDIRIQEPISHKSVKFNHTHKLVEH